jgi:hypothetical protein
VVLVEQPAANHNGEPSASAATDVVRGVLRRGGGSANGHRRDTLGKILRLTTRPRLPVGGYVPPDNPFVGVPGVRPDWATACNLWRFSVTRPPATLDRRRRGG